MFNVQCFYFFVEKGQKQSLFVYFYIPRQSNLRKFFVTLTSVKDTFNRKCKRKTCFSFAFRSLNRIFAGRNKKKICLTLIEQING